MTGTFRTPDAVVGIAIRLDDRLLHTRRLKVAAFLPRTRARRKCF